MIDAEKVIAMAVRELERMKDGEVILKINIVQAVRIIGLVQLSLRHPDLPQSNYHFGRKFCDNMIELISRPSPDLADFCKLGFDEKYDEVTAKATKPKKKPAEDPPA